MPRQTTCLTSFLPVGLFFLFTGIAASSENRNFELVGHLGGKPCTSVLASGTCAYVGTGTSVVVFDISDPASLKEIGSVDLGFSSDSLALSNSTLSVLASEGGHKRYFTIDVSLPSTPTVAGSTEVSDAYADVAASGGFAYAAAGDLGVVVMDISNSQNPFRVQTVGIPGPATGIEVSGGFLCVTSGSGELHIMDLTVQGGPSLVTSLPVGTAKDVKASGDIVAVLSGEPPNQKVFVADLGTLPSPSLRGFVPLNSDWRRFKNLAMAGNYIFSFGTGLIVTIDLAQPLTSRPTFSQYLYEVTLTNGSALINSLFIITSTGALLSFNIADLGASFSGEIQLVDVYDPVLSQPVIFVKEDLAFLGGGTAFRVVDVSDPSDPKVIGHAPFMAWAGKYPAYPAGLVVAGQTAYVASGYGITVFDVSSPADPVGGWFPWNNINPSGITVAGTRLYVSTYEGKLIIMSISNPLNPVIIGSYEVPNRSFTSVFISETVAYVGEQGSSDPYFSNQRGGFRIIDCSNPVEPILMGQFEPSNLDYWLEGVYALNIVLFVVGGWSQRVGGLHIFDITTPSSPSWKGTYGLSSSWYSPNRVKVNGNVAFMDYNEQGGFGGVMALDVSDPENPAEYGHYTESSLLPSDLSITGSLVYLTSSHGLSILRYTGPGAEPTPTPTISPTPNGSASPTPTLTSTRTPTPTSTGVPGATPTPTETLQPCEPNSDMNGDGVVDVFDLVIFMSHWHGAP